MNSFEFALFLHKDYCEFYDKRYSDNYYKEKCAEIVLQTN